MHTSSRLTKRPFAAVAVVALIAALAPSGSALAEQGVTRERMRVEFEDQVDEQLTDACGTTITVDGRLDVHVLEFADGRSKVHVNSWTRLSSSYGTVSTIGTSMIQFEPEQVIDNGDGTRTVLMPHRESVSYVYRTDDGHFTDAGTIDWELRLVFDDDTGALLNVDELIVETTGHFPSLERGGQLAVLCDALNS